MPLAKEIISQIGASEQVCASFSLVMRFLGDNPDKMTRRRNNESVTREFIHRKAAGFLAGRASNGPVLPRTLPDPIVKDILENAYNVKAEDLDNAINHHMQAMGAENFIGWALEAYIAKHAEPEGWAWCSGEIVRFVDFIRFDGTNWQMLQIKNRDNSENSASASVRDGTRIQKWFRTFAGTGKTNWENFPDISLRQKLSENGFRKFVVEWLNRNQA